MAKTSAVVLGAILVIVGIWGLFSNTAVRWHGFEDCWYHIRHLCHSWFRPRRYGFVRRICHRHDNQRLLSHRWSSDRYSRFFFKKCRCVGSTNVIVSHIRQNKSTMSLMNGDFVLPVCRFEFY